MRNTCRDSLELSGKFKAQIQDVLIPQACMVPRKPVFLTYFPGVLSDIGPQFKRPLSLVTSCGEGRLCLLNKIY